MKPTVLDASALLAMLFGEPGMEEMRTLFHKAATADKPLLIAAVNWAEVLNRVTRRQGAAGREAAKVLASSGAIEIVVVDASLAEAAATYKAADQLGLADAFAAALAKIRKADLVTADREFKSVESEIKIIWLK
ncbi:MAG: PIN domain-containing protein [Lacunisphaera sp.]|jgi:predicted nucleic acid-binding protein|nr:PIN domain-containing protein [Lacunisphaera sp.]